MLAIAKAYEVYYVDDHGNEHQLGTFISEPAPKEELRARIKRWIAHTRGDEEARKWEYYGPEYRIVQ